MRFLLAFSSFFRLLFGAKLHPAAARYLPEEALRAALPEPKPEKKPADKPKSSDQGDKPAETKPKKTAADAASQRIDGALLVMGLLQREGRLIDFLRESLDDHEDSDIGAAVRDIHRGCAKVLSAHFEIEAVMPGEEDEKVTVPKGFDPGEIKLVGEANGDPPFRGILRHHGWRATKVKLPSLSEGVDRHVLAAAEVELED